MKGGPIASIIIPAHNEARVITRSLRTLTASSNLHEFDIVVVCNGCTDATQAVAASFGHPDVRVMRIEDSSKSRAMSYGDLVARTYPRLYLDADVELDADGARAMARALQGSVGAVASPVYLLEGCSSLATQYWREWQRRNPHPRAGTGCFGLSEAARTSFGTFPDVLGDDLWVASSFEPEVVADAATYVRVARTIPAVFRRRVRIARGNVQGTANRVLRPAPAPPASAPGQTPGIQGPRPVGLALLFSVHGAASVWARVRRSGGWSQDQTSRRDSAPIGSGGISG